MMANSIVPALLATFIWGSTAAAQSAVPARIDRPVFRVMLATPTALAAINQPHAVRSLFAQCIRPLRIFPGDTVKALATHDWGQTDAVDPGDLTIYVFPRAKDGSDCGGDDLRDQVTITRGLQFLEPSPFTAAEDVLWIELRVGDRAITPTASTRVPLTVLSNRSTRVSAAGAVRIRIPMASLKPQESGRHDGIHLRVLMADSTKTEEISIPWSSVEPLWHSYLLERNVSASAHAATASARIVLSEFKPSTDADLNAAHRAYRSGDLTSANRFILERLGDPGLKWSDERTARLQLAVSFASLGDTAATRILFAGLLQREPCLTLSPTAPAFARAVITPLSRPRARCSAIPLSQVALRSAALPGFGRPGSNVRRALVSGAIGAALITGVSQNSQARSSFAAYQASRSSSEAERHFSRASSARSTARAGYGVAAVVWVASITDALVREFRLSRRLAQVRHVAPALERD